MRRMDSRPLALAVLIASLLAVASLAQRRSEQGGDTLSFRFFGPVVGYRVASIAGIPGDPSIYYAGAASGGVWKTTDGGLRWTPVSDSMPVAAIGALAVAPSVPTNADRFPITYDAGITLTSTVAARSGSRCRSARCTTSPSTTRSPPTSTPTCRTTAPCADRSSQPRTPAPATTHRATPGISRSRRLRVRLHDSRSADPNIVWSTCYGNKVTRYDHRTRIARSVAPAMITLDSPPQDSKYRCHWTAPIAINPFDHNNVYYGCNVMFRTSNGGQSWQVISPDLSTQEPAKIMSSGGIVGDNLGQFAPESSSRSHRRKSRRG
jgi:hypothetical protein